MTMVACPGLSEPFKAWFFILQVDSFSSFLLFLFSCLLLFLSLSTLGFHILVPSFRPFPCFFLLLLLQILLSLTAQQFTTLYELAYQICQLQQHPQGLLITNDVLLTGDDSGGRVLTKHMTNSCMQRTLKVHRSQWMSSTPQNEEGRQCQEQQLEGPSI